MPAAMDAECGCSLSGRDAIKTSVELGYCKGMQCVLAIDAGGSKCDALVVTLAGDAVGWGRCSVKELGSGRGPGGSGRSATTVRRAMLQALEQVGGAQILEVAGYGVGSEQVRGHFGPAVRFRGVREHDAALALVGAEAGIVALAGTGAFVYGRRPDGADLHLDALGPLLGDYGSGYHIGLMAIRAAARASWHPRHATSLAEPVVQACSAFRPNRARFSLVEYMLGNPDRAEIASLAELVDAHAEAGDAVARQILITAADELAETLWDVVDRLSLANEHLPLVGTGGVLTGSRRYWEHFCDRCKEIAPGLEPVRAPGPLVAGVAFLALKGLGIADPQVYDRLLQSVLKASPQMCGRALG